MKPGGELRRCGTRYKTEDAAQHSKRGLRDGAMVIPCAFGQCGGWHVAIPKAVPVADRKAPARPTGPGKLTRDAVYAREQGCCAACGIYLPDGAWRSIQHRVARGVGGGNETSNLVLLCGSATSPGCHRICEDRNAHMLARGFWLKSGSRPELEPVMLHGENGGGLTVWLSDDGEYLLQAPVMAC